ncbi:MAG: alpha/beta hydrolase [Bryobacteraceae bacterium]
MRLVALLCCAMGVVTAERLWTGEAPGAVGTEDRDVPTLTAYLADPAKANGTSVVVCPGGGYGALAMDHEGKQIAEWLNQLGVSAFVLKYRLGPRYHYPSPMLDAQRAIRTVRSKAAEYKVDPGRIGIWGFSAGGHLASTTGTHFDKGRPDAVDAVDRAVRGLIFYSLLSGGDLQQRICHA